MLKHLPCSLSHVFGDRGCLAGARARLYYDGFVCAEGFAIEELGYKSLIAGLLFPTAWQFIDWIILFLFRDLLNIAAIVAQDPNQVIDVQNPLV
jgi:hypothetical protein